MDRMKYVSPPAIKGPTAMPFRKKTPAIVPRMSEGTNCGCSFRSVSPPPPATAARTPAMMATIPIGLFKDSSMVVPVMVPVAMGTRIAAVRRMMPQLSPCDPNAFRSVVSPRTLSARTMSVA